VRTNVESLTDKLAETGALYDSERVTVESVTVAGAICSLNVTLIVVLTGISVLFAPGLVERTTGGVVSEGDPPEEGSTM
jgi:hypothetical protein